MKDLQKLIKELIENDDSYTDLNNAVIITTYKTASTETQYIIDKIFLHLIGCSLYDLINQEALK